MEFLFNVRSTKRETWVGARLMRDTFVDESTGKRKTRTLTLTDGQLQAGCADRLWDLLEMPLSLEKFVSKIRALRVDILDKNRKQIKQVIELMSYPSLSRSVLPGDTYSFKLFHQPYEQVLTEPANPEDLAELVRYRPKVRVRCHKCTTVIKRVPEARRPAPAKGELF